MTHNASNNSLNASGSLVRQHGEVESIFELQRLLNDERNRGIQHKQNYEKLKGEMSLMQNRMEAAERDKDELVQELNRVREEMSRKLTQHSRRCRELEQENSELSNNQVTQQRIEMIRLKIEEEYDQVFQEKLDRTRMELESQRSELMKVRSENMFLKSELDHEVGEHARIIEEMKLIHSTEISSYKTDKLRQMSSCMDLSKSESPGLKQLSLDNGIMKNQIKSLFNELQEARVNADHIKSQLESDLRGKVKNLAETNAKLKKYELEMDSMRKQLEDNHRHGAEGQKTELMLQNKLQESLRKQHQLQMKVDELVDKAKVDISSLQMEAARQQGEIEKQRASQAGRIEELEWQLGVAGQKCGQLEKMLENGRAKDAKNEWLEREKILEEMSCMGKDKLRLESEVSRLQCELRRVEKEGRSELLEERLGVAERNEKEARRGMEQLEHQVSTLQMELGRVKSGNGELKERCRLQQSELDECYTRLARLDLACQEKESMQDKCQQLQQKLQTVESQKESQFAEQSNQWKEDRLRLVDRISELEHELAVVMDKHRGVQEEIRRKNKKHGNYFTKQTKKIQLISAQMEKFKAENDLLRRNVPVEEYQKLRRELKELRRRHAEYRSIIMQSGDNVALGGGGVAMDTDRKLTESLVQLKQRLQQLDERQTQQSLELDMRSEGPQGDTN